MYAWKTKPFQIFDNIGKDLVETTVERSRTLGNSPQAVGKDIGNWKTLHTAAALEMMNN